MFFYLKALHIIFVVTWFAGLFYMPRLLIYNAEAQGKEEPEKAILSRQYALMMRRLWYGITWPSGVLTLILGTAVLYLSGWTALIFTAPLRWLLLKLIFVVLLYGYHFSLHILLRQQLRGEFRFSSQQLRIWNEVATLLLFAIVFLVTVKSSLSFIWGTVGIIALMVVLMMAIRIYKKLRKP